MSLRCNYIKKNRKKDNFSYQKRELFSYLLSVLPKKTLYAFSKKDLKFKRKAINKEAIAKGNFLYYNTNYVTELIFDIDNIAHLSVWDLDWIYKTFYTKFGLTLTWSCKTDKGVQFCISVNTFYKLTRKQLKVLRDFKQYIIDNWALIDKNGSKRLKGWWRNPFKMSDSRFYGNRITFDEILDFLYRNNLDYKQQFKSKIRKEQIKQKNKAPTTNKIYFTIGEPNIGNRNNWIFYNLMLNTNSRNLDTIIELAKDLNKKIPKPLENEELEKIAKNVLNYNKKDKNYIYSNSKKAGWNIGIMGFEKMSGLAYEEYLKETKRRQKLAGKKIGKGNIEKYIRKKADETKEKVYKAIEELKQKDEKITIRKVKEFAKVSLASANKYVKQAKEEGII
jgi:hypothetical protein